MHAVRIPEGGAILDTDSSKMEEYSEYMFTHRKKEYQGIAHLLCDKFHPPHGGTILEIGPGPAWITIFFSQLRPDLEIYGIEASPDMIRVAQKNIQKMQCAPHIHLMPGIVEKLHETTKDQFDLIFSNDSLHHWTDPLQSFQEIQHRLKINGKIFIHDSRRDLGLGGHLILYGIGKLMAGKMWKDWKSSINASYTPAEIKQILAKTDLSWSVQGDLMDLSITN
jgi:SAM-dependent methyltransferase